MPRLERRLPALDRLGLVGGAEDVQVWNGAQRGDGLDRLMGRAVFAQTDGIMGEHLDLTRLHQGGEPQRGAHVIGKDEEGRARRDIAAMQGHAIDGRRHAMFANAPMHETAGIMAGRDRRGGYDLGVVGAGEIGRAGDELRHGGREHSNGGF